MRADDPVIPGAAKPGTAGWRGAEEILSNQFPPYICDNFIGTARNPKICHICRNPFSAHRVKP